MKRFVLALIVALGLCSSADAQQIVRPRIQPQIRFQVRPFIPYRSYYRTVPRYRYYWEYQVNPRNPNLYYYRYQYQYRYYMPPIQQGGIFFQFRF